MNSSNGEVANQIPGHIQTFHEHTHADNRHGDEANQHQGSSLRRIHVIQTLSSDGGFKAGSCGWAPTSPRYSVVRLNFKSAARASVPSAETATAGSSYLPSGNAKRKLNEPSGRNLISRPSSVTLAVGSVAP